MKEDSRTQLSFIVLLVVLHFIVLGLACSPAPLFRYTQTYLLPFASTMATDDLEKKAKEAFVDDNFELAVDLYTQALDLDPKNADLYADRAQANIKLGSFTEAVSDANKAIELQSSLVKAYLRKGTACMKLEEHQTAKAAFTAGLALAPGDSRFIRLIKECDEFIAGGGGSVAVAEVEKFAKRDGQTVVLEETKNVSKKTSPTALKSMTSPSHVNAESTHAGQPTDDVSYQSQQVVQIKPKFRHDYYNTPTDVVLTIFAKSIPPENVLVDFGEQILSVSIDIPGEDAFQFQTRLFGKIIPEKCKYVVLSSKIEIRLSKAEAATWPSLEYNSDKALPKSVIVQSGLKSQSQRPSYPSSKNKVQWDKLEAEVKKEEKDEKLEGDAALNKLFREIYQNADEDMRRAMCKSFVESNGTVLSTNWKDVGVKKVEGSPPDGMELKKWEY